MRLQIKKLLNIYVLSISKKPNFKSCQLIILMNLSIYEEEEVEELGTFHEIRFVLFPIQSRLHFYTLKRRLKHVRNHKDSGIINARGLQ